MNRSGLVGAPFDEWVETLAEADAYAAGRDAYVIASLIVADLDRAAEMAARIEAAGIRCLELNLGAPHGGEAEPGAIETVHAADRAAEIVARVRGAVRHPAPRQADRRRRPTCSRPRLPRVSRVPTRW